VSEIVGKKAHCPYIHKIRFRVQSLPFPCPYTALLPKSATGFNVCGCSMRKTFAFSATIDKLVPVITIN
jgi:hypothetical protein